MFTSLLSAGRARSLLWQLVYWVCVFAVLVPTPLLEFRYFTLPFLLLQLHVDQQHIRTSRLALNCVAYTLVNAFILHGFLFRPYRWPDGSEQRRIW